MLSPSTGQEVYLKTFEGLITGTGDEGTWAADVFLREALIAERIATRDHPNVCRYLGAKVSNGYLVGLAWELHGKTLYEAVVQHDLLDLPAIINDVRQGLLHIHSLGIVHGDIKPANIVLAADKRAVIIDFDTSLPIGAPRAADDKWGCEPWYWTDTSHAEEKDDIRALNVLAQWLVDGSVEGLTGFTDEYVVTETGYEADMVQFWGAYDNVFM